MKLKLEVRPHRDWRAEQLNAVGYMYDVNKEYRFDRSRQANWTSLKLEDEADPLLYNSKTKLTFKADFKSQKTLLVKVSAGEILATF